MCTANVAICAKILLFASLFLRISGVRLRETTRGEGCDDCFWEPEPGKLTYHEELEQNLTRELRTATTTSEPLAVATAKPMADRCTVTVAEIKSYLDRVHFGVKRLKMLFTIIETSRFSKTVPQAKVIIDALLPLSTQLAQHAELAYNDIGAGRISYAVTNLKKLVDVLDSSELFNSLRDLRVMHEKIVNKFKEQKYNQQLEKLSVGDNVSGKEKPYTQEGLEEDWVRVIDMPYQINDKSKDFDLLCARKFTSKVALELSARLQLSARVLL